jgi:hypothetical protein
VSRLFRIGLLALALVAERTALATAQTKHHVIQGRVTTDSGAVIAAADVIVTIAPTAETITSKTDSSGNYRVAITNTTGEYLLHVGGRQFRQPRNDRKRGRRPRSSQAAGHQQHAAAGEGMVRFTRHHDEPALMPPTKRMTACSPR